MLEEQIMYKIEYNSINLGIIEAGMTGGRDIWPAGSVRDQIHG